MAWSGRIRYLPAPSKYPVQTELAIRAKINAILAEGVDDDPYYERLDESALLTAVGIMGAFTALLYGALRAGGEILKWAANRPEAKPRIRNVQAAVEKLYDIMNEMVDLGRKNPRIQQMTNTVARKIRMMINLCKLSREDLYELLQAGLRELADFKDQIAADSQGDLFAT